MGQRKDSQKSAKNLRHELYQKLDEDYMSLINAMKEYRNDFLWGIYLFGLTALAYLTKFLFESEGAIAKVILTGQRKSLMAFFLVPVSIVFAVFNWLYITVLLSVGGLVAGLWGLRKFRYRKAESFAAWWILGAFILLAPFILSEFRIYQASQVAVFGVIALGLNLLVGYSGQLSVGHSAFVLIGAYTTTFFSNGEHGFTYPIWISVILGGIVTAFAGFLVGLPSVRIKGIYLALTTLSLAVVVPLILKSQYLSQHLGGQNGFYLTQPSPPPLFDFLNDGQWQYFLVLIPAFLLFLFANFMVTRHKSGGAFALISRSEETAKSVGVNVFQYKLLAYSLSAFYAGVGGGLYVILTGIISPTSFTIVNSIGFLAAIVVGGMNSILGSFIAGIYLAYQTEVSSILAKAVENGEQLQWGLFGAVLVFFMIFAPRGISGELDDLAGLAFFSKPSRHKNYRESRDEEYAEELFDEDYLKG